MSSTHREPTAARPETLIPIISSPRRISRHASHAHADPTTEPPARDVHTKQLVAECKRIAALSNEEIERRLIESPGEIATKDLAVISGISADKAAKYEGWGRQADDDPRPNKLLDRLEVMLQQGASVQLTVSPRPVDADAIDVEVEPTG